MAWPVCAVSCVERMQREQAQRAHAAAEILAAKHEAAAWRAKLQQATADLASFQQRMPSQVGPASLACAHHPVPLTLCAPHQLTSLRGDL